MGLPLYVKIAGEFKELSAVAVGPNVRDIQKREILTCVDLYLKNITSKKCSKNQKTEKAYFEILIIHCLDLKIFGIDEVKSSHIESLETEFLKRMKPNSVNRRFSVYRHFFNKCDEWGFLYENPFQKVKPLKIIKVHHKDWTRPQFDLFLKATEGTYTKIFKFLWLTGCRPMELKNLKWDDINYSENFIEFECLKNRGGKRRFPITHDVSKLLHTIKPETQFIFSINKKVVCNDNLYQYAKHRLKKLGFNNLSPYGIRHSFACELNDQDTNAFTIKELMGHSDIRTTLNYVHQKNEKLSLALKNSGR